MKVVTGEELCKHPGEGRVRGVGGATGGGRASGVAEDVCSLRRALTRGLMGQRERCWVLLFGAGNN